MTRPAGSLAAAVIAVGAFVVSGCGSSSPPSPSPTTAPSTTVAASTDCVVQSPDQTIIDTVFTGTVGLTFESICPVDVDPTLAGPEVKAQFSEMAASEVTHEKYPVMRVLAGQVKSGNGKAFVETVLSGLGTQAAQANPPAVLATETDEMVGYPVTYFHLPGAVDGYTYAEGPTVLIAYLEPRTKASEAESVLTLTLLNLYEHGDYPLAEGNYTTADDPGWIFFTANNSGSYFVSCGIGPNGEVAGCDSAPEAPEGMNETIVTPGEPALYRYSDIPTFLRDVDELPEGHRLQNGGTRCSVGHQGTVTCATADGAHGFTVSHYAELW